MRTVSVRGSLCTIFIPSLPPSNAELARKAELYVEPRAVARVADSHEAI